MWSFRRLSIWSEPRKLRLRSYSVPRRDQMNVHKNAPLTPKGREAMAGGVSSHGEIEAPLNTNLMESAGCQSISGLCRYAAPFGLESGRSNARDLCHFRRWGRSNCACRGLFTVGAKGTRMTLPCAVVVEAWDMSCRITFLVHIT